MNQLLKFKPVQNKSAVKVTVAVGFKSSIKPGIFCYSIRVYDASGNISAPQEVCITVQSWGGNDDLVGNWNLTKTEGSKDTIKVGVESCLIVASLADTLQACTNNPVSANYNKCFIVDSTKYIINSDGTYKHEIYNTDKNIDLSATMSACEIILKEDKEHFLYKGNWAYDQQKEKLIIVELEATIIEENGSETTETYTNEEAKVTVFNTNVNSSNLILIDDADASNVYKYFFDIE